MTKNRSFEILAILAVLGILITGCSQVLTTGASSTATLVPTETFLPTKTPTVKPTLTPTLTPTLSLPVSINTPIPRKLGLIGEKSFGKLTTIAQWGLGNFLGIKTSTQSNKLMAFFTTGVILYDLQTLEEVSIIRDTISSDYDLSPDGSLIIIFHGKDVLDSEGYPIPTFRIWSSENGDIVADLSDVHNHGTLNSLNSLNFSLDSRYFAVVDDIYGRGRTIVWDVQQGKELLNLEGAYDASFSPDSKYFAVSGSFSYGNKGCGYELQVWEITTSGLTPLDFDIPFKPGHCMRINFLPTGHQLMVIKPDSLSIRNIPTGEVSKLLYPNLDYFLLLQPIPIRTYSPENKLIYLYGIDRSVIIDSDTGIVLLKTDWDSPNWFINSRDGSRLLKGDEVSHSWTLYKMPGLKEITKGGFPQGDYAWDSLPSFSENPQFIFQHLNTETFVYRASDGTFLYKLEGNSPYDISLDRIVTVMLDNILVWSSIDGSLIQKIKIPNNGDFRFSMDGSKLIEGLGSGLRITDIQDLSSKYVSGSYMAYSSDGTIAARSSHNGIEIVDTVTQKTLNLFETDQSEQTIYFSSDNKLLAIRSPEKLTVWQLSTGEQLLTIPLTRETFINNLFITPDGILLVLSEVIVNNRFTGMFHLSIWKISEKQETKQIDIQLAYWTRNGKFLNCGDDLIISPDQGFVAYPQMAKDKTSCGRLVLNLSDFSQYGKIEKIKGPAALSSNAEYLAVSEGDQIQFWDIKNNQLILTWSPEILATNKNLHLSINSIGFTTDNRFLAFSVSGIVNLAGFPVVE